MPRRTRPNEKCLVCDAKCKKPNTTRAFFYCSDSCRIAGVSSLRPLSLNTGSVGNGSGKRVMEMAFAYYVMRKENRPMTGKEISESVYSTFKTNTKQARIKSFSTMASLFNENIEVTKRPRGGNTFHIVDITVPFIDSLRDKYRNHLRGMMND